MILPVELGTEQDPLTAVLEQIPSPACGGFELLPVASDQMPSPVCNGSELLPLALEQMLSPAAPETDQEPSSAMSE